MKVLTSQVVEVIEEELQRASNEYGPLNNSDHESFAIIFEESQELTQEHQQIFLGVEAFWKLVMADAPSSHKLSALLKLKTSATLAACEAVQVAAMAQKAMNTLINASDEVLSMEEDIDGKTYQ